jgi:hypothetical protein
MKHAAMGCAIGLSGWFALALAISVGLQMLGVEWTQTLFVAIVGGLLAWIGVGLIYSSLQLRRESRDIQNGMAGAHLKDGAHVVMVGTISPIGAGLLTAPLNDVRCVAYSYKITEVIGSGERRTNATHARGSAQVPCTIATQSGSYKLLTVPDLESADAITSLAFPPSKLRTAHIVAFKQYAQSTQFIRADESGKAAANELTDRWTDADGQYRGDVAYSDLGAVNLFNCKLEQQQIRAGAQVCVFGTYSANKAGIVPSPTWRGSARLVEGNSEAVVTKLRSRARFHLFFGLLFAGGVVAALVFIVSKLDV